MAEVIPKDNIELQASEAKVIKFTALFAHDLEGPIVSLKAIMKLVEQNRFDMANESHRSLLRASRIALERSEAIIQDMLKAAQAGMPEFTVTVKDCDLNTIISDCCHLAHPAAMEQTIRIVKRLPRKEIIVRADSLLVGRIVDNLIFNAIRHTPPRGEITVSADTRDDWAEITITDTGDGFHDINPEELFTVFRQVDFREEGRHRGVGIGLYFCRMAVEKMGGTITAKNALDRGSEFRFRLPLGRNET